MKITTEEVQHLALLARLELTLAEQAELIEHFDKMLAYMEKLNELQTDTVQPMAHAVDVPSPFREDVVTNQADPEALLQNAPSRHTTFFRVPKIIE